MKEVMICKGSRLDGYAYLLRHQLSGRFIIALVLITCKNEVIDVSLLYVVVFLPYL